MDTLSKLAEMMRAASSTAVRLATAHVQTVKGAIAMWRAERGGLNRVGVLHTIERRIAELNNEQRPTLIQLVTAGEAVDPERRQWEDTHHGTNR